MTMCLYHEHTAEVQAEHQAYRFAPKMSLLYQADCQNRCSCPDGYHSGHTHQEFRHGRNPAELYIQAQAKSPAAVKIKNFRIAVFEISAYCKIEFSVIKIYNKLFVCTGTCD